MRVCLLFAVFQALALVVLEQAVLAAEVLIAETAVSGHVGRALAVGKITPGLGHFDILGVVVVVVFC